MVIYAGDIITCNKLLVHVHVHVYAINMQNIYIVLVTIAPYCNT